MSLPADTRIERGPRVLGWREEARQDRLVRAQIGRERDAARLRARLAEQDAAETRRAARATARRAGRARLAAWITAHVIGLLFVPVIGVPGVLAWTAMAAYGAHLYGPPGRMLPAFSEGAMWAFAAAVTLTRRRGP